MEDLLARFPKQTSRGISTKAVFHGQKEWLLDSTSAVRKTPEARAGLNTLLLSAQSRMHLSGYAPRSEQSGHSMISSWKRRQGRRDYSSSRITGVSCFLSATMDFIRALNQTLSGGGTK